MMHTCRWRVSFSVEQGPSLSWSSLMKLASPTSQCTSLSSLSSRNGRNAHQSPSLQQVERKRDAASARLPPVITGNSARIMEIQDNPHPSSRQLPRPLHAKTHRHWEIKPFDQISKHSMINNESPPTRSLQTCSPRQRKRHFAEGDKDEHLEVAQGKICCLLFYSVFERNQTALDVASNGSLLPTILV